MISIIIFILISFLDFGKNYSNDTLGDFNILPNF